MAGTQKSEFHATLIGTQEKLPIGTLNTEPRCITRLATIRSGLGFDEVGLFGKGGAPWSSVNARSRGTVQP